LPAQPVHDRWNAVDALAEGVDDAAARGARLRVRIADDHGYVVGFAEISNLPEQVMVAHLLGVIAGENDQGIVALSGLVQPAQYPADVFVDFLHQAVIGGAGLSHLLLGHLRSQP